MNGPHDMGGAMNFGPVLPEADEPVFHETWERRVLALTLAMGATGQWNIDTSRSARESIPPARYLASSYYQIWLAGLERLMLARGLVNEDELASGQLLQAPAKVARILRQADVTSVLARGSPTARPSEAVARFAPGDRVRARVMHPGTHTRLPRYVRGKRGRILALHGTHVFADTHATGQGEQPQWLYTVEFDAHELWGPDTTAASVCVDCWESYLEADGASAAR